jgi:hypothetical protein
MSATTNHLSVTFPTCAPANNLASYLHYALVIHLRDIGSVASATLHPLRNHRCHQSGLDLLFKIADSLLF